MLYIKFCWYCVTERMMQQNFTNRGVTAMKYRTSTNIAPSFQNATGCLCLFGASMGHVVFFFSVDNGASIIVASIELPSLTNAPAPSSH